MPKSGLSEGCGLWVSVGQPLPQSLLFSYSSLTLQPHTEVTLYPPVEIAGSINGKK